jgi:hypothetical protein
MAAFGENLAFERRRYSKTRDADGFIRYITGQLDVLLKGEKNECAERTGGFYLYKG